MTTNDSIKFWNTAHSFIENQLKNIRQVSSHTITAYKSALNKFITYLEKEKNIKRSDITFENFDKSTLIKYQEWLVSKALSPKTCNLLMTGIRSFLEYASQTDSFITSYYVNACAIKNVLEKKYPIEYFEKNQMAALMSIPSNDKRTDRRNKMILVLLYDTAARVSEILKLKVKDLHIKEEIPFVTLFGKGRKYRNVPVMDKTIIHLKKYIQEFHNNEYNSEDPLFYSVIHNKKNSLSSDTLEKMIKKYVELCKEQGISMPDHVHCHMIRKSRAMHLYREGVPLTHIQQLLGHENINTTSGFYAFATLDTLAEALKTVKDDTSAREWNNPEILEQLFKL